MLGALVCLGSACASAPRGPVAWSDAAIETSPAAAQSPDEDARFARGEDGFLYVVGDADLEVGQRVYGRYDGVWPMENTAPPALFVGKVVEKSQESWRVHPLYTFPDSDVLALRPVGADGEREKMGKGVGTLTEVDFRGPTHLGMDLGGVDGVQRGDMYMILRPGQVEGQAPDLLTRRLLGVCMVVEVEAEASTCRLRPGHSDYPWAGTIAVGDRALFAEPTFGNAPAEAVIYVSAVEGNDELTERVVTYLQAYVDRMPGARVSVEPFYDAVDATDPNFHRWSRLAESNNRPALLVGLTRVEHEEGAHLVINYTGLSPALGTGMVAAPPEGGVDMGRIDLLSSEDFSQVGATVLGSLMVYRGQNAEALAHLHDVLRDPRIEGPWRWHARDQYAMRWAAMKHYDEALWLVLQDEAMAAGDERAYLNALGTRVRLLDFLEKPQAAHSAAGAYLEARQAERPETSYLSALAMYGEMSASVGDFERTGQVIDEIVESCPDNCQGDAIGLLAGIYWSVVESPELSSRIVSEMLALGRNDRDSMAGVRMFQGWNAMGEREFDVAMIAFLEARRLFEENGASYGKARADLYLAIVQMGRDEPQAAFEHGIEALNAMTAFNDYTSTSQVYDYLSGLYGDIDTSRRPEAYLGGAPRILQANLQARLSSGNYSAAADAAFGLAHFLFRVGELEDARSLFKRSVTLGLRSTRFDICALAHLFLGLAARAEGDMETFQKEVMRAQLMGELAEDSTIDELIQNLLSPQGGESVPTQLL
ncbi:hypothetical protein DL240_00470 [Lujinxingia litoralis]|uniref:Tetratricopeptide repeat protein n=1 Tax=Lujinxingia litoralis TaxID=2211119 RepID=A0A328C9U4_9DELT|nr:hypothetical protein DL240_00470 [Lujinxingia litoralis]